MQPNNENRVLVSMMQPNIL